MPAKTPAKESGAKLTPMMRQWSEIKQAHPDCIILFRLGDFYEAFNEDAEQVAEICDVVLTSRPVKKGARAPMAGVPYHAVDGYIAQIVRAGRKVAIVEQTGEDTSPEKRARMSRIPDGPGPEPSAEAGLPPAERKKGGGKLMSREVVRVVTPGTLIENELLEAGTHNFLAALAIADRSGDRSGRGARRGRAGGSGAGDGAPIIGLATLELSTGTFLTTQFEGEDAERRLIDELTRLRPAELVHPDADGLGEPGVDALLEGLGRALKQLDLPTLLMPFAPWRFDALNAQRALKEHFGVAGLAAFGCEGLPAATAAAGAALAYAAEAQKGALRQITGLATYSSEGFMRLDAAARRTLEVSSTLRGGRREGTLLWVLDRSKTAMGARSIRHWLEQPLLDLEEIEARQDAVACLVEDGQARRDLRERLRGLPDIERMTNRVLAGYAGPREILRLAEGIAALPDLRAILDTALQVAAEAHRDGAARIAGLLQQDLDGLRERIERTIAEEPPATLGVSGVIRPGHSSELDAIHASVSEARDWIAGLEEVERAQTGIKGLKVGYNKVFGYYLHVPKSASSQVPEHYHRKQTLANAERYITPELKDREAVVLEAEERIIALERSLFQSLCATIGEAAPTLLEAAGEIGRLDALASLAEVAVLEGYARPRLDAGRALEIEAGRHPVVEAMRRDQPFVPNDMRIGEGEIILLTGPNMAGKSTVGRQVALICLMAQMGSFVPARAARIGLVDRIFTRIGAQDEIAAGQSTFMVEMVETASILHHATDRSLIILDELGRGTSTYDGMSIAWAVIEHIHNHPRLGARTIFATHYHELTALETLLPRLRNLHLAVAETDQGIAFLHEVREGSADRSYGVHVAELAGLPPSTIRRAWEILERLEEDAGVPIQPATSRPGSATEGQLSLFAPAAREHPVLGRLRELDPDGLSPIEALTLLYELRLEARDGADEG